MNKIFTRLLLRGAFRGNSIALAILKWRSTRELEKMAPTSSVSYGFEIPDLSRPLPEEQQGSFCGDYELKPFEATLPILAALKGREICEISTTIGTYGMGGYGFFGLKLNDEWLVIAVGSAGNWMTVNRRRLQDYFCHENERETPWVYEGVDALSPYIIGSTVLEFEVLKHSMRIELSNGAVIELSQDPHTGAPFEETGKQRLLLDEDDLRRAVFLCPTSELWA